MPRARAGRRPWVALADHRASAHFTRDLLGAIVPLLDSRTIEEYDVPE